MDPSLRIDLDRVKRIVLETVETNGVDRAATSDSLLETLKSHYPGVNAFHLRYKLSKVMRALRRENVIREIEKRRIDFGRNAHGWARHVCLIDLNMVQCLRALDKLLGQM